MRRLTAFLALALMVLAPAANAQVVLGVVNSGTSSYTTGESRPFQLNPDGSLKVGGNGGAGPVGAAPGSTTAGQTGVLTQCATTTATPTYVNGTTNPISCNAAGEIRVRLSDSGTAPSIGSPNSDAQSGNANAGINTRSFGLLMTNTGTGVWSRMRDALAIDTTGLGSQAVVQAACSAVACGVASVRNTAVGSAQVLKASAGNLYDWQVTSGASAGYVLIFNATTAPADGAVTPAQCVAVAANTTVGSGMTIVPEYFSTGITVVFSTTGCFTKTASATAFIRGRVQ